MSAPLEWSASAHDDMSEITLADSDDSGQRKKVVLRALAASAVLTLPLIALTVHTPLGRPLDAPVLFAVNDAAANVPGIETIARILDASIPETLVATSIVALWFAARGGAVRVIRRRAMLIVLALFPAYGIARVLQGADHRVRPILATHLHPLADPASWHSMRLTFSSWGSFPSDHAALLAIVVVAAFTMSRRAGFAFAVLAVIVSIFRVAVGYHWPSDVVGGTLLGVLVAAFALGLEGVLRPRLDALVEGIESHRALAYPLAFFALVDLAHGFGLTRLIAHSAFHTRIFH
ncbi:MAG TPA: phosphatase PAP2 family protein [Candidatus Acidoferrum sp.]|nr:phosphatase PAP2 family protein [Candidatus Acidoferrum sp.]